ncbi:MAG: hypothetical protein J1D89_01850 [Agathobacter sp.]|nr:hypothetical protein [Agathobacter sp.]
MFGKGKVNQEEIERLKDQVELDDNFFALLEDKKAVFEADVAEIDASYRQVEADAQQVRENMKNAVALAEGSANVEAELIRQLNEYRDLIRQNEDWQLAIGKEIQDFSKELAVLVEENKHFTSPSKRLSDCSSSLKGQNQTFAQSLDEMADASKQMGVLALGAAIEAGRLGDPGRQFVAATEEIRTLASNYDKALLNLRSKLEQSQSRINELEEQVQLVVRLLRENNVTAAKVMKSCNALAKKVDKERANGISDQSVNLKNQVMILKNADEELIKSGERNRMQMDDLIGEFTAQQKNQKEMFEMMDLIFRHAIERKAEREEP